jgi:hypothetical protein
MTKTTLILSTLASTIALASPAIAAESSTTIVTGASVTGAHGNLGATAGVAVVREEAAVKARPRADSLFYLRLGQGVVAAPGAPGGPGIGIGYRLELERFGIDASLNLHMTDMTSPDKRGYTGSLVKLTAQYYFMPQADHTPYLGAGLSWGLRSVSIGEDRYSGNGLQGEIIAGYEFLRNSNIRAFVQAGASLPFYMANRESASTPRALVLTPGARYLPTMGLSFGVAWGR